MVQSIIAGGLDAMLAAVEDIEDCKASAPAELRQRQLTSQDVVVGIAASGRTPFVISALDYARQIGAKTIALSTRGLGLISQHADVSIAPDVGAEVLAGSTRMKSGSAQKMLLGMLSTSVMRCNWVKCTET
ncbi:SIS domain-containing protein [Vibrio sp. M60_M31a]